MTAINMDYARKERCGVEEAVFCQSKSAQQIDQIVEMADKLGHKLLFTRLSEQKFLQLAASTQQLLEFDSIGSVAVLGKMTKADGPYQVVIVSGGASDTSVCREIAATLNHHNVSYALFEDIGVAGLYRLTEKLEEIKKARLVIAVAGMEAALPTVLAGLIANPIIAVPTSVGYGVSEGGHLALHSCLGSCASGLLTVNIDNGFGAACAAIKIIKQLNTS